MAELTKMKSTLDRVVMVLAEGGKGELEVSTGCLLSPGWILTSGHGVREATVVFVRIYRDYLSGEHKTPDDTNVVKVPAKPKVLEVPAKRRVCAYDGEKLDAALLELVVPEEQKASVDQWYGSVGPLRRVAMKDVLTESFTTRGFPKGACHTQKEGRLEGYDRVKLSGTIEDYNGRSEYQLALEQNPNEIGDWAGVSGAPVLVKDGLVGLVRRHAGKMEGMLWAVSLDVVEKGHKEFTSYLPKVLPPVETPKIDLLALKEVLDIQPVKAGVLRLLTDTKVEAEEKAKCSIPEFVKLWQGYDLIRFLRLTPNLLRYVEQEGLKREEAKSWLKRLFIRLIHHHPEAPADVEVKEAKRRGGLLSIELHEGEVKALYKIALIDGPSCDTGSNTIGLVARTVEDVNKPFFDLLVQEVGKRRGMQNLGRVKLKLRYEVERYLEQLAEAHRREEGFDEVKRPVYFSIPAGIDNPTLESDFAEYLGVQQGRHLHIYSRAADEFDKFEDAMATALEELAPECSS